MIAPRLRLLLLGVLLAGVAAAGALAGRSAAAPPAPLRPAPLTLYATTPTAPAPATSQPTATPISLPTYYYPQPSITPVPPQGTLPAPCHRNNFSNSRWFPATGAAVSGEFSNYWARNGDLPQQGYPISPVIAEVSELDGQRYTVQYFERAVFECHPENFGSEYAVLLAQLGTFQYRQQYPQGAPGQSPNGERSRLFAATGRTLGGEFRTYWETHGGLAQQGLPLSDEFSEVSPLDGQRYTVQYFERAVFEYHPQNAPPYRVLLSQLGTLRYRAKYPAPPPPVALPTPNLTGPLFLGYAPGGQCGRRPDTRLAASGAYLFWRDANSPAGAALLGYDATARRQLSAPLPQDVGTGLVTDGRTLAWQEEDHRCLSPSTTYLHGYNLQTGREFPPLSLPPYTTHRWAVNDDTLYFDRGTEGGGELDAHNWTTGQTARIATVSAGSLVGQVVAGNGYVAWTDYNRDQPARLYLAPARNPTAATVISTGTIGGYITVIIAGDHLLWTQAVLEADGSFNPYIDVEVRMYTISTRTTQVLDRGGASYLSASENRVAWLIDDPYPAAGITRVVVLDLATGQKRIVQLPASLGLGAAGGDLMALVGPALAYIQPSAFTGISELYLQPLP